MEAEAKKAEAKLLEAETMLVPTPPLTTTKTVVATRAAVSIKAAAATKGEERVTHRLLEKSKISVTGAWQGCENCKNRSQNGQNF